jgi:hypothetical protein
MKKLSIAAFAVLAVVLTAQAASAWSSCTTNCYGNTCTRTCY